jgi:crotonobetainyl-CoA:carnitine CoA-transferase CaiB-like acyl-CoA transferase
MSVALLTFLHGGLAPVVHADVPPDCGSLPAPCIVPRVPGRALPIPRTGPGVGEHNAQVYANFGVDAAELARLKQAGVI